MGWFYDHFGSYAIGLWSIAGILVLGALVVMLIPMQSSRPSALP